MSCFDQVDALVDEGREEGREKGETCMSFLYRYTFGYMSECYFLIHLTDSCCRRVNEMSDKVKLVLAFLAQHNSSSLLLRDV